MFSSKHSKSTKDEELITSCMKVEVSLKHDGHSDVEGKYLFTEFKLLREVFSRKITKVVEVSNFWTKIGSCYPNTRIAYRILLKISISVVCVESFSKLKLIKNYLRSTMSQERLKGLANISISIEYVLLKSWIIWSW